VKSQAGYLVRVLKPADIPAARALWKKTVGVSRGDDRRTLLRLLKKNPGTCLVAIVGGKLVGKVMGTQDARRGYIFHLAVDTAHRRRGIASALIRECIKGMRKAGARRIYLFARSGNRASMAFWKRAGWRVVDDVSFLSRGV